MDKSPEADSKKMKQLSQVKTPDVLKKKLRRNMGYYVWCHCGRGKEAEMLMMFVHVQPVEKEEIGEE